MDACSDGVLEAAAAVLGGANLYREPSVVNLRAEREYLRSPNSEESYMGSGSYEENGSAMSSYPGRSVSEESRESRDAILIRSETEAAAAAAATAATAAAATAAAAIQRLPAKFPEYKH